MKINLHIERLVLDGVDIAPGQSNALKASVTTELTRRLTEGGFSSGLIDGNTPSRLNTNSIQLSNNNPTQIGQKIAQSVYGGIGDE
jgi:hypothetical protein